MTVDLFRPRKHRNVREKIVTSADNAIELYLDSTTSGSAVEQCYDRADEAWRSDLEQ